MIISFIFRSIQLPLNVSYQLVCPAAVPDGLPLSEHFLHGFLFGGPCIPGESFPGNKFKRSLLTDYFYRCGCTIRTAHSNAHYSMQCGEFRSSRLSGPLSQITTRSLQFCRTRYKKTSTVKRNGKHYTKARYSPTMNIFYCLPN